MSKDNLRCQVSFLRWVSCLSSLCQAIWPTSFQIFSCLHLSLLHRAICIRGGDTIPSFPCVLRIWTLASNLNIRCLIPCHYFIHWAFSLAFKHNLVGWKSDLRICFDCMFEFSPFFTQISDHSSLLALVCLAIWNDSTKAFNSVHL